MDTKPIRSLDVWCLAALNGHGKWEFRGVVAHTKGDLVNRAPMAREEGWRAVKATIVPRRIKP